jgi:hypothetical protein
LTSFLTSLGHGAILVGIFVVPVALVVVFFLAARRRGTALLASGAFLALVAAQLWTVRPGFFRWGQSSDVLWMFLAYFVLGFACLVMGIMLLMVAVRPGWFAGWPTLALMRKGQILGLPLMIVAAVVLNQRCSEASRAPTPVTSDPAEQQAMREVEVGGQQRVRWEARGSAPAFDWTVPREAFSAGQLVETADGPRTLVLRLPGVEPEATLTIHRDESTLPNQSAGVLNGGYAVFSGAPYGFWIDRGGGWKLMGLTCHGDSVALFPHLSPRASGSRQAQCFAPETPLESYFPGFFGISHHDLAMRPRDNACDTYFRFRGRPATISTIHSCASPGQLAALTAGMAMIDRLDATFVPP